MSAKQRQNERGEGESGDELAGSAAEERRSAQVQQSVGGKHQWHVEERVEERAVGRLGGDDQRLEQELHGHRHSLAQC